jgi:hypothetical protein
MGFEAYIKKGARPMKPEDILEEARRRIRDHAGNDPDKWFYANRYVYARLQLDERKTKTDIKKNLFNANVPCHYCGKPFEKKTGVHLHRLDEERGQNAEKQGGGRLWLRTGLDTLPALIGPGGVDLC